MRLDRRMIRHFVRQDLGTVLTETIIAVPLLTLLAIGMLEFGNILWQRHQMEVGVRDAARYWARCRPTADGQAFMPCSETIARNIAFFGNPAGSTGRWRVPGWDGSDPDHLRITPALNALPTAPTATDVVEARGQFDYRGSPLIGVLNLGTITLSYTHEQRYIGW
jgi:Flp pilus assembly protein TadG